MEERVSMIGIIVENMDSTDKLNALLHEYGSYIIGRMGIPYPKKNLNIISIALDAPMEAIEVGVELAPLMGILAHVEEGRHLVLAIPQAQRHLERGGVGVFVGIARASAREGIFACLRHTHGKLDAHLIHGHIGQEPHVAQLHHPLRGTGLFLPTRSGERAQAPHEHKAPYPAVLLHLL